MNYERVIGEPGRIVIVRMEPGAELASTILEACRDEGIETAIVLSFIGTINEVYLRNPRQTTKLPVTNEEEFAPQVDTTVLIRQMEIVSIEGNITTFNGELFHNLHGIFSEAGGVLRGGHIFRATIWSQCELMLQEIKKARITRERDQFTGLPQWQIHQL